MSTPSPLQEIVCTQLKPHMSVHPQRGYASLKRRRANPCNPWLRFILIHQPRTTRKPARSSFCPRPLRHTPQVSHHHRRCPCLSVKHFHLLWLIALRVYQLPNAQVYDHGIKRTEASSGWQGSLSDGLIKLLTERRQQAPTADGERGGGRKCAFLFVNNTRTPLILHIRWLKWALGWKVASVLNSVTDCEATEQRSALSVGN